MYKGKKKSWDMQYPNADFYSDISNDVPVPKSWMFFSPCPPLPQVGQSQKQMKHDSASSISLSGKFQRVERKKSTRWKPRVNTLKTEFLPVSSHRGRSSVSADEIFQQTLAHLRFFPYLCILKRDNCQIKKTLREQWRSESKQCALPPWWLACQVLLRTTSR